MINITIQTKNSQIVAIKAEGHSGYAESGKDIVCSAISSILQTAALGLTKVQNLNAKIEIDEAIPLLEIDISHLPASAIKSAQTLLKTACLGVEEVRSGYKKYIKIKEKNDVV